MHTFFFWTKKVAYLGFNYIFFIYIFNSFRFIIRLLLHFLDPFFLLCNLNADKRRRLLGFLFIIFSARRLLPATAYRLRFSKEREKRKKKWFKSSVRQKYQSITLILQAFMSLSFFTESKNFNFRVSKLTQFSVSLLWETEEIQLQYIAGEFNFPFAHSHFLGKQTNPLCIFSFLSLSSDNYPQFLLATIVVSVTHTQFSKLLYFLDPSKELLFWCSITEF